MLGVNSCCWGVFESRFLFRECQGMFELCTTHANVKGYTFLKKHTCDLTNCE